MAQIVRVPLIGGGSGPADPVRPNFGTAVVENWGMRRTTTARSLTAECYAICDEAELDKILLLPTAEEILRTADGSEARTAVMSSWNALRSERSPGPEKRHAPRDDFNSWVNAPAFAEELRKPSGGAAVVRGLLLALAAGASLSWALTNGLPPEWIALLPSLALTVDCSDVFGGSGDVDGRTLDNGEGGSSSRTWNVLTGSGTVGSGILTAGAAFFVVSVDDLGDQATGRVSLLRSGTSGMGPAGRIQDNDDFYLAYQSAYNSTKISKYVAGSYTEISGFNHSLDFDSLRRLGFDGTTLEAFLGDSSLGTATGQTDFATGKMGIHMEANGTCDRFIAEIADAGGASPLLLRMMLEHT